MVGVEQVARRREAALRGLLGKLSLGLQEQPRFLGPVQRPFPFVPPPAAMVQPSLGVTLAASAAHHEDLDRRVLARFALDIFQPTVEVTQAQMVEVCGQIVVHRGMGAEIHVAGK